MRASLIIVSLIVGTSISGHPSTATGTREIGDARVWTTVPAPGQPGGIAVAGDRVLVSTLGLVTQPIPDPRLFSFDAATGALTDSVAVSPMMTPSAMALYGVATDAVGRAYVVDMNGRINRVDPRTGTQATYAEFPAAVAGVTTMPVDLVFDESGYLYVTDQNLAAIWRVAPGGGEPELWFQDPRLFGYLFGPTGIRIDPTGRYLYFTVAISQHPATAGQGLVYRLPLDNPAAEGLEEFARYATRSSPFGIEFGASGKLYVALAGPSQISVLRPDGSEEIRFPDAAANASREVPFDRPLGVAFDGRGSLLVTNSNALSPPNPSRWVIFDAWVADTARPRATPSLP